MAKKKPVKAVKAAKPAKDDGNATACAVLSYLLVGIIWYFVDEKMKKSQFARFHAKQGLALLLAWIVVQIVGIFVFWIPVIGWLLWAVVSIFFLVVWILGIVYSATGKQKDLPVIGALAGKLTF